MPFPVKRFSTADVNYTVARDIGWCNDACAAASRAIGTLNGEQLT
jgi:hypothetical protein